MALKEQLKNMQTQNKEKMEEEIYKHRTKKSKRIRKKVQRFNKKS